MSSLKARNGTLAANIKTLRGGAIAAVRAVDGLDVPHGPSGAPTAVSATPVGTVANAADGRINLTWTNGDATAQTRIYNGGSLLATASAGATTYSVTGLNANTSYTLTVKHYKGGSESSGATFAAATTFRYNGYLISHARGTNDDTVSGFAWSGTGYDKISTYADGNNATYNQCPAGDTLSSAYCQLRVTGPASGTYTVPAGVTAIRVFICAAPGATVGGARGGGSGAVKALDIATSEGAQFAYSIGDLGADTTFTQTSGDATPTPAITCYRGEDGNSGIGAAGGNATSAGNTSAGLSANSGRTPNTANGASYGGGASDDTGSGGYSRLYPYGQDSSVFGGILAIIENP